jgi:hypothetical protein
MKGLYYTKIIYFDRIFLHLEVLVENVDKRDLRDDPFSLTSNSRPLELKL